MLKYIKLTYLLKYGSLILFGLLAFFGIFYKVQARSWRTPNTVKYCPLGTQDPNSSSCTASSSSVQLTNVNGVNNSIAPIGIENSSNGNMVPNPHSIIWIRGNVPTGESASPCYQPGYVSYNVYLNLEDSNNILNDGQLNPNYQGSNVSPVITASIRNALLNFTRRSYSNSSPSYYQYLDNKNTVGVSIGTRTSNSYSDLTSCTFVQYGSTKYLKFKCTVNSSDLSKSQFIAIQYPNWSYNSGVNSYYDNLRIRDVIKIDTIYDPCDTPNNADSGSVVDSINEQTESIADGLSDLQDQLNDWSNNQNNNFNDIKDKQDDTNDKLDGLLQKADELKNKQDSTNSKLDDIKDGIEQSNKNTESCKTLIFNGNNNPVKYVNGYLNSNGIVQPDSSDRTTDYIKLGNNHNSVIQNTGESFQGGYKFCGYDENKTLISCQNIPLTSLNISSNFYYIRLSYLGSYYRTMKLIRCSGIGQTLVDSDTSSHNNFLDNFSGYTNPTDIRSLLNFPKELLQTIEDNADSCSSFSLDFSSLTRRFGGSDYVLELPCMGTKIKGLIGNDLYNTIDGLMSFGLFILFICHLYMRYHEVLSGTNGMASDIQAINDGYTETHYWNSHINQKTGEVNTRK